MSRLTLKNSNIKFFNNRDDTDPCITLTQGNNTADNADITLRLPNTLPADTNTNVLSVSMSDGQMEYANIGEIQIDGTFNNESEGAVGLTTTTTINNAMEKIDSWIFKNLVDHPPSPSNLLFVNNTTTSITITWDKPQIYQIGILDKTIPYITNLNIKIYKASSTSPTDLTGTVSHNAGENTLVGDQTDFTNELSVGDSITIEGDGWSTGPTTKGTSNSVGSSTLLTDGWDSDPSNLTNQIFVLGDYNGEYKITGVSGTYADNTSEITLTLDRNLTTTINDNTNLIGYRIGS